MPSTSDDLIQVADALNRLAVAMEQLPARYAAAQRVNRRLWIALVLGVLTLLGIATYSVLAPVADLMQRLIPPKLSSLDPAAAAAEKQRLMETLPVDQRERIEGYEKQMEWVHRYMDVYPDFNAGAMVAYFLAHMSTSVEVMPDMYTQVRAMQGEIRSIGTEIRSMNAKMDALPVLAADVEGMNAKMNALPVLATEVQGMHIQMSVMATGMDSTMGRAGRMLPFPW